MPSDRPIYPGKGESVDIITKDGVRIQCGRNYGEIREEAHGLTIDNDQVVGIDGHGNTFSTSIGSNGKPAGKPTSSERDESSRKANKAKTPAKRTAGGDVTIDCNDNRGIVIGNMSGQTVRFGGNGIDTITDNNGNTVRLNPGPANGQASASSCSSSSHPSSDPSDNRTGKVEKGKEPINPTTSGNTTFCDGNTGINTRNGSGEWVSFDAPGNAYASNSNSTEASVRKRRDEGPEDMGLGIHPKMPFQSARIYGPASTIQPNAILLYGHFTTGTVIAEGSYVTRFCTFEPGCYFGENMMIGAGCNIVGGHFGTRADLARRVTEADPSGRATLTDCTFTKDGERVRLTASAMPDGPYEQGPTVVNTGRVYLADRPVESEDEPVRRGFFAGLSSAAASAMSRLFPCTR